MEELSQKLLRTSILLQKLFKARNLKHFLKENEASIRSPKFNHYIMELCRKTGTVPEQIIKRTVMERTYGHQIFNGRRKPSRDKALQLAFGFGLNVDETQRLLRVAQKAQLYPRIKRDAVILHCIEHHYNIMEAQDALMDLQLTLLGGQKDG